MILWSNLISHDAAAWGLHMRVRVELQVMGPGRRPWVYKRRLLGHQDPGRFSPSTSTTPFFRFLKLRNKKHAIFCRQGK